MISLFFSIIIGMILSALFGIMGAVIFIGLRLLIGKIGEYFYG